MAACIYPQKPHDIGQAGGVTMTKRSSDKVIPVRHNVPGNIIIVHGVNDVGTSYAAVERGLCEGLSTRLNGDLRAAEYRLPEAADKNRLETDPDAVFFKRAITEKTLSPVIPFYWGFREQTAHVQTDVKLARGQQLDRNGNRLDKDYSKGGGPFANATTTLPDLWNRGKWGVYRLLDVAQKDATHPVLNCPGRMYMILAAQRLAALICMIRDYDNDETVSIVAHSQGCLISLLAQAFLLDPKFLAQQKNARPADCLILNNPPYSLIDDFPFLPSQVDGYADRDEMMEGRYLHIDGVQTLNARLTTLSNIVKGVWSKRHATPVFAEMNDAAKHFGAVGPGWKAAADRDNRGKVYLYFGPEDMTVALVNVQGIGWQGVPRFQRGTHVRRVGGRGVHTFSNRILRRAFEELGEGFRQRVFTMKRRPDPVSGQAVKIGETCPHDFLMRAKGEDDQAHTALSDNDLSKKRVRGHLPSAADAHSEASEEERREHGLRCINGEILKVPVAASMHEGAKADSAGRPGALEDVDPIDAAIAVTSAYGLAAIWECLPYEASQTRFATATALLSPAPTKYDGLVGVMPKLAAAVGAKLNAGKSETASVEVLNAYVCLDNSGTYTAVRPGKILIRRLESPDEARLRWQNTSVPRSFHGAIFGGKENHRNVTAYDVAIGGGKASSDPMFYKYLCAVADWRIQTEPLRYRTGILQWNIFNTSHAVYLKVEPKWRWNLIEGNAFYYSSGELPQTLPLLPEGLPTAILCELIE